MRERAGRCRADDKLRAGWVPALRANRALARGVKPRLPEPVANNAGSWIGLDEVQCISSQFAYLWIRRLVPSSRQVTIASNEWISQCPPCAAAAPLPQLSQLRTQSTIDGAVAHTVPQVPTARLPSCVQSETIVRDELSARRQQHLASD